MVECRSTSVVDMLVENKTCIQRDTEQVQLLADRDIGAGDIN